MTDLKCPGCGWTSRTKWSATKKCYKCEHCGQKWLKVPPGVRCVRKDENNDMAQEDAGS